MATRTQRHAQEVIEQQCEAIHGLLRLRQHSTVRSNATLAQAVEEIWQAVVTANALACVVWFPRDTHADLPKLPPAA